MTQQSRGARRQALLMPIALIAGLAAALPAVYLSATSDPQGNLEGLPVAIVLEDQSVPQETSPAALLAEAIEASVDDKISLSRMTEDEVALAMKEDRVAGAIIIPDDFDAAVASVLAGRAPVTAPTVTLAANAGDGGLSNGLMTANLAPVVAGASSQLGEGLVANAAGANLSPAQSVLLTQPVRIASVPYEPLPPHAGLGTSAFYYSLILVLISFIGASLVNPLVDSSLGVIPSEVGPLIARQPYSSLSRRRTFLRKAMILAIAAPVAAAVLQAVAAAIGVLAPDPLLLWVFASAAIAAVGVSALAIFATLGPGIGSLVNTLFFVALAMVASGGIVPLEATPGFFQLVSSIAPFRHVIDGVRSLLYFDGNLAAGLGEAWISVAVGGAFGLLLGIIVTTLYGRVPRFSRDPHDPISSATSPVQESPSASVARNMESAGSRER